MSDTDAMSGADGSRMRPDADRGAAGCGGAAGGVELRSRVERSAAIVFTELDDTVVMMDVEAGLYYELDPVGSRIWTLLERGPQVAGVCETLIAEYEVTPELCREDVRGFLEELRSLGVVRMRNGDGAWQAGT